MNNQSMTQYSLQISSSGLSETHIPSNQEQTIKKITDEIKNLVRQTAQNIIDIGNKLQKVKQILGHGKFVKWLETEFNWSISIAAKMMQASQRFNYVNFTDLNISPSAIYLLAAPSTPDSARSEALSRASEGQTISYSFAKELVYNHKNLPKSALNSRKKDDKSQKNQNIDLCQENKSFEQLNLEPSVLKQLSEDFHWEIEVTSKVKLELFQEYLVRTWFSMMRLKQPLSLILCLIDSPMGQSHENLRVNENVMRRQLCSVFHQVLKRPSDLFTDCGEYFLLLLPLTDQGGATMIAKLIQSKIEALQVETCQKSPLLPSLDYLRFFIYDIIPTHPPSWEDLLINLLQNEIRF